MADQGRTTDFRYDDDTTRVIKRGAGGEVIYVNQWYVDNAGKNSKHVFAGTTRLVTKLEMPPKSQPPSQQPPGPGTGTTEKFFYFYHPDHLGSTSYVTDQSGEVYQHLEYFPFGETWVDESPSNSTDRTPYRFTGKEFDEETQLYYFGARYYDPRTSLWTAADPALGQYLPADKVTWLMPSIANDWRANLNAEGQGGAFEPRNINLYGYGHQNPLVIGDPDGNSIYTKGGKFLLKGGDVAATFADLIQAGNTLADPNASVVDRGLAAVEILSELAPVSIGDAKDAVKYGSQAADFIKGKAGGAYGKLKQWWKGCSFDASTLVATKDGLKRIDHLSVNELVLAKNEETGETAYKQISDMFVNTHEETVRLRFRPQDSDHEEEVLSSINHPFFVVGKGWLSVSELAVGDKIETSHGSWARLLSKTVEPEELRAFSLEVRDHHTFFVGETQAWVHNGKKGDCGGEDHHIATDKSIKSGWTEKLAQFFKKADRNIKRDADNIIENLAGHKGRHSPKYHNYVFQRLQRATQGLSGKNYDKALSEELGKLRQEILKNPDIVKGKGIE